MMLIMMVFAMRTNSVVAQIRAHVTMMKQLQKTTELVPTKKQLHSAKYLLRALQNAVFLRTVPMQIGNMCSPLLQLLTPIATKRKHWTCRCCHCRKVAQLIVW